MGGRVENQARATRSLLIAIAIALFAVFVLLYGALGSMREAGLILSTVPMALVGGIVALFIANESWNVSSLVGLIGLFGIAVQNSLVLITQTRALLSEGHDLRAALREASIGRVRPKLMTASTAILGLLPLVVLQLHGTEVERPLAIVMIGGLLTSTLFTLLVLPTMYLMAMRNNLDPISHEARGEELSRPKGPRCARYQGDHMKLSRPGWVPVIDVVFVAVALIIGTMLLLVTVILWIH